MIYGYYAEHSTKFLGDFENTLELMNDTLVSRFGAQTAAGMKDRVRTEFEHLLPEIPYITGPRATMFNFFLFVTAQEVAAFRALREFDLSAGEIWQLCHQALRLSTVQIPAWKTWFLRKIMFSRLIHWVMERRARLGRKDRIGDFEIEYLSSEGEAFDLGINYHQCANYRFAVEHDAAAFAPYICMSDIALSDAFGWGLQRTRTIADGCGYCDFRMKQGAPTRLSSRTPDVQKTIELIEVQENAC